MWKMAVGPIVTRQTFRLISNWKRMNICCVCRLDSKYILYYIMYIYGDNDACCLKVTTRWQPTTAAHIVRQSVSDITLKSHSQARAHMIFTYALIHTHTHSIYNDIAPVPVMCKTRTHTHAYTQTITVDWKLFYNIVRTLFFRLLECKCVCFIANFIHLHLFSEAPVTTNRSQKFILFYLFFVISRVWVCVCAYRVLLFSLLLLLASSFNFNQI